MKFISLLLLFLFTFSTSAAPTYCNGLSTKDLINSSNLTFFKKKVCRYSLKSCYSAYSKSLCDVTNDDGDNIYTLNVLGGSVDINPSSTQAYNFKPATKDINQRCTIPAYGVDFKRTSNSSEFTAKGAYVKSSDGCHYDPIVSYPDGKSFIEQSNPEQGPLLGEYRAKYTWITPSNTRLPTKIITINIKDTTAPSITLIGDNPIAISDYNSFTDLVSITDNYLPDHSKIALEVTFKDSTDTKLFDGSNNVIKKQLSFSSGTTWSGTYEVPLGATTIVYKATDSSDNYSQVEREIINYHGTTEEFLTSRSVKVPIGITSVNIKAVGAGGSGAYRSTSQCKWQGSGGGSGASLDNQVFSVTQGEIINVTIGQGGAGGHTGSNLIGGDTNIRGPILNIILGGAKGRYGGIISGASGKGNNGLDGNANNIGASSIFGGPPIYNYSEPSNCGAYCYCGKSTPTTPSNRGVGGAGAGDWPSSRAGAGSNGYSWFEWLSR
jgi:hypothetical protein